MRPGSTLSIRLLLTCIMGLMGLMLLALGVKPSLEAAEHYATARRLVVLSATTGDLFEALQNLRNERGNMLSALNAEGAVTPALEQQIYPQRQQEEAAFDRLWAASAAVDLPGFADEVSRLRQAHQAVADLRAKADSFAHGPRSARDPAFAKLWSDTGAGLLSALGSTTDLVDGAIRLHDAAIDSLLSVKRAAWATRNAAGEQALAASTAIASRQAWTLAQALRASDQHGQETAAWSLVSGVASRADAPPRLRAAYAATEAAFYGRDQPTRQSVFDALAAGRLPDMTIDAWVGFIVPSLGTINGTTTAALADMADIAEAAAAEGRRNLLIAASVLVLGLALITAGFIVVNRRVSRPMQALTVSMRRLAERDFAADVPGTERGDELGEMAKAVSTFRENGIAMQRLETETAERNRRDAADRDAAEAARNQAARHQTDMVEALAAALSRLAEGDLTCQLDTAFPPAYERLRNDFNDAVVRLREAVGEVVGLTTSIENGTREISAAAGDLARRTQQQAAGLEETASTLGEITEAVGQTASGSERARQVAATATEDAVQSGRVMTDAGEAMTAIQNSAQQISQIISVMDEIAFQTNLLALNAGVEAARAGDAGRGFAVVASEVRALAQRSADAAKEIKALILTSTQQVERGVALVGETGASLGKILSQVQVIGQAVGTIAGSAREQSTGLAQVSAAVNAMDKVVQQNAAMVEQSTAAAEALSSQTQDLARATSRFRISTREATRSPVRAGNVSPLRPRPAPAPRRMAIARAGTSAAAEDPEVF